MSFNIEPCFIAILLYSTYPVYKSTPECQFGRYVSDEEGKLDVFPINFYHEIGPNDCYEKCQAHGDCLSVNYHRKNNYCELLNQKKTEDTPFESNSNFVHVELEAIADRRDKKCGLSSCNHYSTCISTLFQNSVCIETECSEPYPSLTNGHLSVRTFSPITATYVCNSGYTGVGPVNKITCPPGGTWSAMSYTCYPPVHGGWGGWSAWETCPVTCGGGYHSRQRSCNNPSPNYGGNNCGGLSNETVACNTDGCPIDGRWSLWSQWSECTCLNPVHATRSRSCNNPTPMYGGLPCAGDSTENKGCFISGCIPG
uniref:Hemicentin-1 n=1 Tax=Magallana gigas TaxID=29159 RepID=A0A8W8JEW1_MAGGI|nr:coadhesin [Crassostrea gigas]